MTALAGVWYRDGRSDAGGAVRRMLGAQNLYGPHGDVVRDDGDLALGRCLFDILPEDAFDRGVQEGGGGRYRLVGDVRLDNREELAEALGIDGFHARRLADAAFLVRAWEKWGAECFARLYGDYAFALWDAEGRQLVLARDPLGARPLHYHLGTGFVAFASMPKGLHALADVPYRPDEEHAAAFLALLPEIGPRTFFEGVSRVEPGHYVVFTRSARSAHCHWPPRGGAISRWTGGDPIEAMRAHLDRAVAVRLRGCDRQVGAHLSGGIDSSAVASTAARLMAQRGGQVTAFTAVPRNGYDGPVPAGRIGDEGPLAAATAAMHANMQHRLVRVRHGSLLDEWDRDFHLLERPILNPFNQQWSNAINTAARAERIQVILTGAMGNATISYAGLELLPELLRSGRLFRLRREMAGLVGAGVASWRGALGLAVGHLIPAALWSRYQRARGTASTTISEYSTVNMAQIKPLLDARKTAGQMVDLSFRPHADSVTMRIWHLLRFDIGNYQKASLGGWGVDVRDPSSDRRLIEFCLSLPTKCFLSNGQTRALALRAFADRLPQAVIDETRRGLQSADWHEIATAARDEIRAEINRLPNVPAAALALDLDRIRKMAAEWDIRSPQDPNVISKYRQGLMRGVASGHFLRKASRTNA